MPPPLLEWPKSRTPIKPNADKGVQQQKLTHCRWACKGVQPLEKQSHGFLKRKCSDVWFSNFTRWYLPEGVEGMSVQKPA